MEDRRTGGRKWLGRSAALLAGLLVAVPAGAQSPDPLAAEGVAPEIRAQLTARQFTTLSSEIAARIDRIATRVGERFNKGDILVQFDCAIQRAALARARAALLQTEKTYAINARLSQLKSIGQLELEISAAEVQKAKAEVSGAEATASKCTIAAPFAGVTVDQKAREFQYAAPAQPLLEILDDQALEIELIAPSRWLGWLLPGTTFEVHMDETGRTYPARIERLGGRVDPVSQSVKIIGELTGNPQGLMPGMSGRAIMSPPRAN
ncbi:efflux RND transporter periplasmic adaptor subunit [Xanthobacteraceae bacterium Astr-EGSB]|uniref:efflux RND transporter periplasmic adaptor subunit n=1 Tax=Astrobacterium formosum TaxID=3069710 RepID=UPI0027B2E1A8|nr:efflux RND transporter periplasmic adaptor subunit [Xanthobacteraceae bacterium Astr-EGSB]